MILSIIIPAYNVEKYIRRCLDTLIVPELIGLVEIIVVNDGSTDDTKDIVLEYINKFPNLINLINKENGGHGSALNVGISCAKGDYIRIIDGDDWVDTENFVNSVYELGKVNCDAICMPYQRVNVNSFESEYFYNLNFHHWRIYEFDKIDTSKIYFALASTCYSSKLLKRINILFPEHTYYVDVLFNIIPALYINTVCFFSYKCDVYRYGVGNETQSIDMENMKRRYKDHESVIFYVLDYCEEHKELYRFPQKKYIKSVLGEIIHTHYDILLEKAAGTTEIEKFSKRIQLFDNELYRQVIEQIYLLKAKNMLNKLSPRLMKITKKIYKKLK